MMLFGVHDIDPFLSVDDSLACILSAHYLSCILGRFVCCFWPLVECFLKYEMILSAMFSFLAVGD